LVHRLGILGKALPLETQAAQQARQLLARYGVVTHESLAQEIGAWDWGLISQELHRLELRGEVRRGYFVQGMAGVQVALPEVVERLRAGSADGQMAEDEPLVLMNACDPANVYGALLDAAPLTALGHALTFARIPSNWLVLSSGLPILLVEDTGAQLTTMQGISEGLLRRALDTWLDHLSSFKSRVTVERWNSEPVLQSEGRALLEGSGFYRDYPGMTWERR
jgi:ATP-dependent Lhr-like helicase